MRFPKRLPALAHILRKEVQTSVAERPPRFPDVTINLLERAYDDLCIPTLQHRHRTAECGPAGDLQHAFRRHRRAHAGDHRSCRAFPGIARRADRARRPGHGRAARQPAATRRHRPCARRRQRAGAVLRQRRPAAGRHLFRRHRSHPELSRHRGGHGRDVAGPGIGRRRRRTRQRLRRRGPGGEQGIHRGRRLGAGRLSAGRPGRPRRRRADRIEQQR